MRCVNERRRQRGDTIRHRGYLWVVMLSFDARRRRQLAVLQRRQSMRETAPARSPPSLRTTMPPFPSDVQWFPAEIRRLIVAIKKHESLYNPRHDGFGLRDAQNKAWKAVATLVGGGKTGKRRLDLYKSAGLSVGRCVFIVAFTVSSGCWLRCSDHVTTMSQLRDRVHNTPLY
ncbi:hypothetical protein J6590_030586 [Homalodisca vitripennis]|nr:hypothetical protein J6590_030586 [Homalodisca vitripennis]